MIRFLVSVLLCGAALSAETADAIWSARYVVTMDAGHRLIENGAIAVRGSRIVGVGSKVEIVRRFPAAKILDRPEAILIPGLINTHTHAAMSLFRGVADDMRLQEWLTNFIFPAEAKNVTSDFVYAGTKLACLEMMLSGTTSYVDMYYFEERVAEATREAGMRGVLGQTVIGFPTPDSKTPEDALARTAKFIERFRNDPLITAAVAPHALFTNSPETLRGARALANRYGAPLVIHLSETRRENEEGVAKYKMSPTRFLDSIGLFEGTTIAAHGVWLDDADIEILRARHVGVAHCPSSNMKLASGVAPIVKLLGAGIATGLGTDGPAGSNNDFNMMEEMNLAANLQKVASGDPTVLPARQALEMATIDGARVIGREKDLGSLEEGKLADIVSLRIDRANAIPLYNVYSQIVYALKGSDVRDVMINGRTVVLDGRSLTLDPSAIFARARVYQKQVSQSLAIR